MEQLEPGDSAESALLALAGAARRPIWLHLLVADRCNHACLHCYQVQGLKGELSREQIERLLREFRRTGGFVVSFSGGEATLRDDLIGLLAFAHDLGLATVLYTNGFSITEELANAIAACHVWRVDISIYSHRAEEHDAVTRVPGSWAKAVQGVVFLRARRVNVTLKFTPTSLSTATTEQIASLARELGSHLMVAEQVSAGEGGRFEPTSVRRHPSNTIADFPAPSLQLMNGLDAKPCGAGNLLRVRSDGQVQPCSKLNTPMGQIGEDASGLAEAAASDVAQFFRQVTWADFPGCRECDLRTHCRRCFASAVTEAGDMLAPYRGACELAVARYRKLSDRAVLVVEDEDERDSRLGPYCVDADGNLKPVKARYTANDHALLDRYPWLRQGRDTLESSACSVDSSLRESGLIQLRRSRTRGHEGTT